MKTNVRKTMISFLKDFSQTDLKKEKEIILQEKLIASPAFKKAKVIGAYFPQEIECDLSLVFATVFAQGKVLACPVAKNKQMTYYTFQENAPKIKSAFGIFEPEENPDKIMSKEDLDLLIVPGLIFNQDNFRIGFGGGYYDRFLADFKNETVSLAFQEQLQDFLPESFDIPVKKIWFA